MTLSPEVLVVIYCPVPPANAACRLFSRIFQAECALILGLLCGRTHRGCSPARSAPCCSVLPERVVSMNAQSRQHRLCAWHCQAFGAVALTPQVGTGCLSFQGMAVPNSSAGSSVALGSPV